jgi:hypothetical protein
MSCSADAGHLPNFVATGWTQLKFLSPARGDRLGEGATTCVSPSPNLSP